MRQSCSKIDFVGFAEVTNHFAECCTVVRAVVVRLPEVLITVGVFGNDRLEVITRTLNRGEQNFGILVAGIHNGQSAGTQAGAEDNGNAVKLNQLCGSGNSLVGRTGIVLDKKLKLILLSVHFNAAILVDLCNGQLQTLTAGNAALRGRTGHGQDGAKLDCAGEILRGLRDGRVGSGRLALGCTRCT